MIIRLTLSAVLLTAGIVPLLGQHLNIMSPVRPMPAPRGALPYGNILFPGGIPQSFPAQLSGTISGSRPYTGVPYGPRMGRPGYGGGRNRTVVVPYAVPVYTGPYYGYGDYGYAPQQAPTTVVVPQQPTPTVVINQHYPAAQEEPRTVVREYGSDRHDSTVRVYEGGSSRAAQPAAEPKEKPQVTVAPPRPSGSYVRDDKPTIFLIAMKDTTVRQAIGYWVDDNTLHYVTPKGTINHVTLDMVDSDTSVQLNAERKLEFDLNAARK